MRSRDQPSAQPLLERTARQAAHFLDELGSRPVAAEATVAQLRDSLRRPLPDDGVPDDQVIDDLVRDVDGGIVASAGGRFFGWVIGGSVPAALAADWLTSTWDQNAALYACGPAVSVIEEVAGEWLKELFRLPPQASFAMTTGTQLAHFTALAAARHKLLYNRGWDVERHGLAGAPQLRVLSSGQHHASIDRAVRMLGIGTDRLHTVGGDTCGRIDLAGLERALAVEEGPTIVCLQAGEINTGAFDPFASACRLAHAHGAWVHVDGAVGLWVAASERHQRLLAGAERADSWTADGHKWLNVPFDAGFAFVRHQPAHQAAMSVRASYLTHADTVTGTQSAPPARDQLDWNPEWSRRGRGVPVYAAIRALGRRGIGQLIDRCCDHAGRLVAELSALPGAELLIAPTINQGLVRFLASDGDHDTHTDRVIQRIQDSGQAWFGGTTWNGMRAMRVSVVNWQTSDHDIDRAVAAVRAALDA